MARKVVKKSAAVVARPIVPQFKGPILASVRGHEAPIRTLLEAITRGRLASTLLFIGPSGVGKKRVAHGLAQVLVCERSVAENPAACGECGQCLRTTNAQNENVLFVEPQGAGIKIEQAHDVLHFLSLRQLGRARVVIINDAHTLNPQAGNALLKALEEPPSGTHFILITSQPGALLSTIRSRSQAIRFNSLSNSIVAELTNAPDWIVNAAQGSLETATRLTEGSDEWGQLRRSALTTLEEMVAARWPETMETLRELIKERAAALFVIQVWNRAIRDFAFYSAGGGLGSERLHLPDQMELTQKGARLPVAWLEQLSELCLQLEQDIHRNIDKSLAFENLCLAMVGAYSGREPRPMLS